MKKFVAFIIVAYLVAFSIPLTLSAIALAEENDFVELIGYVHAVEQVEPDLWLIHVDCRNAKLGFILFYADSPEWSGKTYLLLFGKDHEVIDAFMVSDLEEPFGASSFFIFMRIGL